MNKVNYRIIGFFAALFCAVLLVACGVLDAPDDTFPSDEKRDISYDFMVLGDNRPHIEKLVTFLASVNTFATPYCFHMGDMIEFSSPLGFLAIREAVNENLGSDITFVPVVGNHDVYGADGNTSSTLKIFNYFMGFAEDSLGYRLIESPEYAFIILNTFLPQEENTIGPTQFTWLENTLASISPDKDIFVFMHHPMFPAGAHVPVTNRDALHTLFTTYNNVIAVFSGHEHVYYHSVHDDIHYYVTGGAGSPLHEGTSGHAIHHMLGVTVSPNFHVDVLSESGEIIPIED